MRPKQGGVERLLALPAAPVLLMKHCHDLVLSACDACIVCFWVVYFLMSKRSNSKQAPRN